MLLALLAFLGGALTILSPCILPVLPFVFARTDQPFARSTLPMLAGMALTFAAIATLAAVGGAWAAGLNAYGRVVALVVLAALGVALLSERAAELLARPFVALGNRLSANGASASGVWPSALLGVATGLVWAPCAGPILGLILTGAAISGPSAKTTLLLFAYALGAIASLAAATLAGARVFAALKRSLGAGEWIRRTLGVLVLAGVAAIALGLDTGALTQLSSGNTNRFEQRLIDAFSSARASANAAEIDHVTLRDEAASSGALPIEGELPSLDGATSWLGSAPLTPDALRGKVVLIDFWTYSCINCIRALPFVRAWYEHYKDHGLVVIGVHTPEFAFEKVERNVRDAIARFDVHYPVALDNDYAVWKAFHNRYWPAHYFIDAQGRIRGHHFGEGEYDRSEQLIRTLLVDAGARDLPAPIGNVASGGIEQAAGGVVGSPETYVGYARAERFASPGGAVPDAVHAYDLPDALDRNQWALGGEWTVGNEKAVSHAAGGRIAFRFHARDVHLVLGPGHDGAPIRFKVTVDGHAPGDDHGADVDANGAGLVREQRLYQLVRQAAVAGDRTCTIEFDDPGVSAFAFTFG